jgi:hypothetical protein
MLGLLHLWYDGEHFSAQLSTLSLGLWCGVGWLLQVVAVLDLLHWCQEP